MIDRLTRLAALLKLLFETAKLAKELYDQLSDEDTDEEADHE